MRNKYPNFTIEFNQTRVWQGYELTSGKPFYLDYPTKYNHPFMIAGPFGARSESISALFEGKPAVTAMFARIDRASGRLNLEVRKWQEPGPLFGKREEVGYIGSCDTIEEARAQMRQFEEECEKRGLGPAKSPSWINGYYSYATRIHDRNAKTGQVQKPAPVASWPGFSKP